MGTVPAYKRPSPAVVNGKTSVTRGHSKSFSDIKIGKSYGNAPFSNFHSAFRSEGFGKF